MIIASITTTTTNRPILAYFSGNAKIRKKSAARAYANAIRFQIFAFAASIVNDSNGGY